MVGADAGGDRELEVLRFGDPLGGQIGRPERLRDDDVRVGSSRSKTESGPSLSAVTTSWWPAASRNLRRPSSPDTLPSNCPGCEIDRARRRQGLAVGVAVEPRQIVAGIVRRIAVDRIVVEDAQNLRHWVPLLLGSLYHFTADFTASRPLAIGPATHRRHRGKPLRKSSWFAATAIALAAAPLSAAPPSAFDPARLSSHVQTLGSDGFEGRAPATRAETKTVDYIIGQFREAGLEPGGDLVDGRRQWTQAVPLLKSDIVGTPRLTLDLGNGQRLDLARGDLITVRSPTNGQSAVNLADAPLVFVGYGVSAPERNWDDFKGLDVKGKLLVVLINDPDFEDGDGDFGGKAMTYYGRWTYKYEEAARRGAAGVLIVHETAPASYGWGRSRTPTPTPCSTSSARTRRPSTSVRKLDPAPLAEQIFAASGLNIDQAKAAARLRGFRPIPLKATLTVNVHGRPRPSPRTMSSGSCPARNIPARR